jgi:hypothetical protein
MRQAAKDLADKLNSIPQIGRRATVPITIHRIYQNRAPAMQFLLEESDTLLKSHRLPRKSTKLSVGRSTGLLNHISRILTNILDLRSDFPIIGD